MTKGLALALLLALQCLLSAWAEGYGFSPVTGQVTSDYGWRTDPLKGGTRFHGGIDIAAPQGAPVYAPQSGQVVFSGAYGGYGNVVVLNHGNTLFTVYGHNSRLLVLPGERVYRGQVIALVGSTGRSTGPHLHFEVHYKQQYLHPMSYLAYVQHSEAMLAQASQRAPIPAYSTASGRNDIVTQSAQPRSIHRQGMARQGRGGRSVELLNGGDPEMVEF